MTRKRFIVLAAPLNVWLWAALVNLVFASCALSAEDNRPAEAKPPEIIQADGRDLQTVVDAAATNSVVICNRNHQFPLATPVTIRKPLTLQGINARLPKELGNTPLLVVEAEGVAVTDFELTGNSDSVPQKERCALLIVKAGGFRIERGLFVNSSKDGVMIDGPSVTNRDIVGGIVRDIVGRGCVRDVVSIGGGGVHGHRIRNVLVDNVRGYDSRLRGAVEVSDGTDNITVRKVYAERSVYALDVQDHSQPQEINSNVVIEDVYAVDCTHAIRTANKPHGHSNLTMRDITAERCTAPLKISNTSNVTLQNVRVLDHPAGKQPPISITRCDGVSVRDVAIKNSGHKGPALLLDNCNDSLIDGLSLQGETNAVSSVVCFRAGKNETYSGLRIHNVTARGTTTAGILLEQSGKATLTDYLISGNFAPVLDRIQGQRAIVNGNLP
jgi:hypothetical protein